MICIRCSGRGKFRINGEIRICGRCQGEGMRDGYDFDQARPKKKKTKPAFREYGKNLSPDDIRQLLKIREG